MHDEVTIVAAELDPTPLPRECSYRGPVVGGCAADYCAIAALLCHCASRSGTQN
jgi:hypothetical protein